MDLWEKIQRRSAEIDEATQALDEDIGRLEESTRTRLWNAALETWGDQPIHRVIMADPVVGLEWKKKLFREQYCNEIGRPMPGSKEWLG
jgi:hypothetical protein